MKNNAMIMAVAGLGLVCGSGFRAQAAVPPAVAAYQASVLAETSLISYYAFDSSTAADSKGTNDGTLQGTAVFAAGVGGGSDKALNLDGDGWDQLGVVAAFDYVSGNGTVEMWLRAGWNPSGFTNYPVILASWDTATHAGANYAFCMDPTKSYVAFFDATATWYGIGLPANAGTNWHHLAIVFSPTNSWTLVWDGVNAGTGPIATRTPYPGGHVQMGSPWATGGFANLPPWTGKLDEVAFYSTNLPVSSIQAHYDAYNNPPSASATDPLDTPYWQTFHINTYDVAPGGGAQYRQLMLANTAGVMPRNVKVGFDATDPFLFWAVGGYYDYLPSVFQLQSPFNEARANDVPIGVCLMATPWDDSAMQSQDILCNFLEKYNGGSLLQQDRYGRIRNAALPQDPTIDEQSSSDVPCLEMQLTLSRNAPLVQDYLVRNTQMAARYFGWLREQAPDIVAFCTMSSEYRMNSSANNDYCDYSSWSVQEFRDWLSGAGLYAGQGQYASLATFNAAFNGAANFPWASWSAVQPPVTVLWNATPNGNWWQKWHQFRVAQVRNLMQVQMRAARSVGWSPDRLYGHQLPGDPNSTTDPIGTLWAGPWTTTFVQEGSGGVDAYGLDPVNATMFNALYADDKNWALTEYNPMSTSVASNLNALNTVWNASAHMVCPYSWSYPGYAVSNTAYLTALQQFISTHSNSIYSGMAAYEAAPDSRDVIWTMSYADDVASASGLSGRVFRNGVFSAAITGPAVSLSLALDSSRHTLASDTYYAASLQIYFSNAPAGPAMLEWTDTNNVTSSVSFNVQKGWNLCHVNLAENAAWRGKRIRAITLKPPGGAGNGLQLDWVRLEAGPCWHFDDPNEVYGVANFAGWAVTNGQFSGTSGSDGYLYLATDKRSISAHADRAFIDADFFKKVRVRLTSAASGYGQLYWWKNNEPFYTTAFLVNAGTQTYEIDLSADLNWSGVVTRFRLDPVNSNGVACAVDYVALSPALLPPRAPYFDPIVNSPNPVFVWQPADEPDHAPLTYDFQLATDFGFTNVLLATTAQSPTNVTYGGPELDGVHWWRVRSRDGGGNVSPWLVPLPLFVRVWNGNSTNDFFTVPSCMTNVAATSGIWSGRVIGVSNPVLVLNTGNDNNGLGVNADLYKRLQLRLNVNRPGGSSSALFYFQAQNGTVYTVNLIVPPDGLWHEQTIDLSSNTNWTGCVRAGLFPSFVSNAVVSVDWVRFLPTGALAPNQPPVFPILPNPVIMAGSNLTVNAAAADPNSPAQALTYSLTTAPTGANLNPTNGLFSWRPTIAQSPSTNPVVLTVADNGVPALSATQSFSITVTAPVRPAVSAAAWINGQFRMTIAGDRGPDYTVLASTNLTFWSAIWMTNAPSLPFIFTDSVATNCNQRFYRVLLGP